MTPLAEPEPSGSGAESDGGAVCAICLGAIEDGEAKTLRCNHVFHAACIDKWSRQTPICPTCRTSLNVPCVVRVRGIECSVAWSYESTVRDACGAALHEFSNRFQTFSFRFYPPHIIKGAWLEQDDGNSWMCACTRLSALQASGAVDKICLLVEGTRGELPRNKHWIPHDQFQWGQMHLEPPTAREFGPNPPLDAYYRRRPGWAERAEAEHDSGACGWSRTRRVCELEAELAHDADDAELDRDDEAWARRRPRHVLLRQARAQDLVTLCCAVLCYARLGHVPLCSAAGSAGARRGGGAGARPARAGRWGGAARRAAARHDRGAAAVARARGAALRRTRSPLTSRPAECSYGTHGEAPWWPGRRRRSRGRRRATGRCSSTAARSSWRQPIAIAGPRAVAWMRQHMRDAGMSQHLAAQLHSRPSRARQGDSNYLPGATSFLIRQAQSAMEFAWRLLVEAGELEEPSYAEPVSIEQVRTRPRGRRSRIVRPPHHGIVHRRGPLVVSRCSARSSRSSWSTRRPPASRCAPNRLCAACGGRSRQMMDSSMSSAPAAHRTGASNTAPSLAAPARLAPPK